MSVATSAPSPDPCSALPSSPPAETGAQHGPAPVQPDCGAACLHLVLSSQREDGQTDRQMKSFPVRRDRDSPKPCSEPAAPDCTSACYLEGNAARRWPGDAWQRLQADFFLKIIRFTIKMNSTINIDIQFN